MVYPLVRGILWRVLARLEIAQAEQSLSRWVQDLG